MLYPCYVVLHDAVKEWYGVVELLIDVDAVLEDVLGTCGGCYVMMPCAVWCCVMTPVLCDAV
jgi:hypothetical protein